MLDNISVPAEVCREGTFLIQNNSSASEFEWDLCPYDLSSIPTVSKVMNTGMSSTIDLAMTRDEHGFYGFAVDANANSLIRLDFGDSPENIPTKVNLGNIGGLFQFPHSVALVQEGSIWLGIVANASNEKVVLLNFGSSLGNVPTGSILFSRGGSGFANVAIASLNETGMAVLLAEFNTRKITVLNYPDGLTNPADGEQNISIPGTSPIDVQVFNECGNWHAMVLGFDDRKLHRIDFGSSFDNSPVLSTYGMSLAFEPYRLVMAKEGDTLYAFVSSTSGGLNRISFGTDMTNEPTLMPLGSFGVLSNSRSLYLDADMEGKWRGFMINFSDGALFRFSFKGNCGISTPYSIERDPGPIRYSTQGSKKIVVKSPGDGGLMLTSTFVVTVREETAPPLVIESTNSCVNAEIFFRLQQADPSITNYAWDFGDEMVSSLANPSHVFASAGTFSVSLVATSSNSCSNLAVKDVNVFERPVSNFLLPSSGRWCTNQEFQFENTSSFQEGSQPYWRWFVNNEQVSIAKDLFYAMGDVGPYTIKLIAGIPGCESSSEHVVGPLTKGPNPDFDIEGICFGDPTRLLNISTGEILSFEWDFGDDSESTQTNPTHTYIAPGEYEASVVAYGISGCNNMKTKTIHIQAPLVVDFDVDAPPLSCNGKPTEFLNKSLDPNGTELSTWLWSFDDPNDSSLEFTKHPKRIFDDPGVYSITLTATSEFGCTAEKTKEVVIHESPSTVFHHSTTCDDLPVTFSTSAGQNIAHFYWEIGSSYYYDPSPTHTFKSPGDFPVYLEVIGTNGCIAETNTNIHVPVPLSPDFSVIKNCVDQQAIFTDITSGLDPVATRSWNFNPGGHFTGQEVGVTFQQEGEISATLRVTAESGCSYETTRPVVVLAAPHASFEATPTVGGYPLEVQFLNTSSDATHYLWSLQNETSSDVSPIHTFREAGDFDVTLTAFNEQECEHTFTGVITAVPPLPDADIDLITLSPNDDGTYRLIVTIHNRGNTFLRDVPVDIDFGGSLQLREVVQETIAPSSKYNLVLGTGILRPDILEYLCVSMEVSDDRNSSGNRKCLRLDNDLYVFNVFPNPASGQLSVEWISHASHTLRVSIVDALGREMLTSHTASAIGLNRQTLDVSSLEGGVYYLLIEDGATRHRQRIVVSNNR